VVQGGKFTVEIVSPIGDDRIQRDVFGDAEVQVDIGPSVLSAVRRRASHRSSRDPGILFGESQQLPSQRITMIAGEHSGESSATRDSAVPYQIGGGVVRPCLAAGCKPCSWIP
jgi:hypothetical protein